MKLNFDINRPYALALEGGGAKGAYQIGVWKALQEAGVRFSAVSGSSVGSLNGALIMMGDVQHAVDVWENITYSKIMDIDDALMHSALHLDWKNLNLKELFQNGARILRDGGMDVEPLRRLIADTVDEEIVVCGYKLKDMMYTDLREYLPENFDMLLVASQDKWSDGLVRGVMGLSMPIKVYDLMNTIEMMLTDIDRRRRKRKKQLKNRDPKQQETVRRAKELLMARNNMTEEEAHRYLQKSSMDSGTNMVETAEMVLSIMSE